MGAAANRLQALRYVVSGRRLAVGLIPVLLVACLDLVQCAPIATNLGTPIRAMSIRGSLLVRDPVTGRPTFYSGMFTSSGTARLIRFDYATDRVEYFPC